MHLTILNTLDLVTLNRSDTDRIVSGFPKVSEGSKSSTHYLGDKTDSTFRAKALHRELVWGRGGWGKHACFYTSEYIKTTRDKIKTNQMDLIKTRNK